MRRKNELLPKLQEKFEAALTEGKILSFKEAVESIDSLGRELNA